MHRDDVSVSDNSSNSEDEIDRIHNKAKEALEKAKAKQYPAFAIRSNIAFNAEYLSPEDVPLPAHMITFGVKDFLHVKERFNQDWWIARLVRIGGSLGFIPSPAKIEAIRVSIYSNQTAQPTTNESNNSPDLKDNQPIFNSFDENPDNPQVNLNERPLLFNNQLKKQSSQPGPIQNLAASRRLVPELDEEGLFTNEGLNGDGENTDMNNATSNSTNKIKTPQSAPVGGLGMKRKPFLKKLNMIQPYEIVPCMRPVIFLGPALKGFEVTDMMQKAIFDFLRKHFEGRIIVTRINADITQVKRIATTNFEKKSNSLDNKKKNTTLINIQQEIERIFDLSSTMQLVVLDADTINHPSQIAKTCLAPLLVYIKIVSLKVLSRLIKNRGKSQKHNASFQISAAEKLQQCADETFDLILDQNNLTGATECLRHFLDTYWTATHPPHLKSKADRILGYRDNSGRKSSKHDLDYSGNVISQMGIDAGFTLKEMNSLLGPTLSWTNFNKNTDTSSADAIHDSSRTNLIWGGDPEEYRSDREMRVDQKDRNSSSLVSMLDLKNSKNETVTPITKPIPSEIFASKIGSLKTQLLSHTATSNHMAPVSSHDSEQTKVYTSRSYLQQKQRLLELEEKKRTDKDIARQRRKQLRINVETKRSDLDNF
uniref:Voltage-operated calcium channel subunit beta-2 n=1 Tax=Dugesia japonica TaxID=6161 RepID=B8Y5Z0_DUGJA|nr:voltage-operated calcium channel subunit beta-2 [Dugesia japonica]